MTSPIPPSPPLHTSQIDPSLSLHRLNIIIYSVFLCILLNTHINTLFSSPSLPAALVFVADAVLSLLWALSQAFRWHPLRRQEHPDRLTKAIGELPGLDVFVCTADPFKEPPIGVVNTALSAMAFNYPSQRLSVYLSDDGGSELTLFAFAEAARFAGHWLPFCRDNGVQERSPERFFQNNDHENYTSIKELYKDMKNRVERAVQRGFLDKNDINLLEEDCDRKITENRASSGFHPKEHSSMIQVLLDSRRDIDVTGCTLPTLVYVSREKRKTSPHHFKAGALNTLLRVSSLMTNAPIVLTLDCDMVSNDPNVPYRALCYIKDHEFNSDLAFVQFPQRFHNINRHDIYGGTFSGLFLINPQGMDGLRGPNYVGSGTFFNRRALHGDDQQRHSLTDEEILERAYQAASCTFEDGTMWGSKVGFRYGSLVEDYHTGLLLHSEGWKSVFCNPQRAAFLGDAPTTLNDSLNQVRRWMVGLLEILFSWNFPLILAFKKNMWLMGMCYAHYSFWPFWCIPLLIYGTLPQMALLHQKPLFSKANDPWILIIYVYLFTASYIKDFMDFISVGGTYRMWWNNQRMWMIRGVTSLPFGSLEYLLEHLGFPGLGFNVTNKFIDKEQGNRYEDGKFEFGPTSPNLISIGTIAIINVMALLLGLARAPSARLDADAMLQLVICGFVVLNCLPIYEAMLVRRDGGSVKLDCVVKCLFLSWFICFVVGPYVFVF